MQFIRLKKIRDGKYLKNYELTYLNKAGNEKKYEMVSRSQLENTDDLGKKISGVSVVAFCRDRLLLLKEFRMSINKNIFNLCAGILEEGETIEECIKRELYEETGLGVKQIYKILPPSYSAVGISDMKTYIAFVEAEGVFEDHTSDNELIQPGFYTKEEVQTLLETEEFSSRAQIAAYFFSEKGNFFDDFFDENA